MSRNQRLRALCCNCGHQRRTTEWQGIGEAARWMTETESSGGARCVVWRKCAGCDEVTMHAYLREDERRDECEAALAEIDVVLAADAVIADSQVEEALGWLDSRGVKVVWSAELELDDVRGILIWHFGEDSFKVVLASSEPPVSLAMTLEVVVRIVREPEAWCRWNIMTGGGRRPLIAMCPVRLPAKRVRGVERFEALDAGPN